MNDDIKEELIRLQREMESLKKDLYELREIVINLLNMVVGEEEEEFYDYT